MAELFWIGNSGGPGFNLTVDHPEQVHRIHVSEASVGKTVVICSGVWKRYFASQQVERPGR